MRPPQITVLSPRCCPRLYALLVFATLIWPAGPTARVYLRHRPRLCSAQWCRRSQGVHYTISPAGSRGGGVSNSRNLGVGVLMHHPPPHRVVPLRGLRPRSMSYTCMITWGGRPGSLCDASSGFGEVRGCLSGDVRRLARRVGVSGPWGSLDGPGVGAAVRCAMRSLALIFQLALELCSHPNYRSSRLPALGPTNRPPDQRAIHDRITTFANTGLFIRLCSTRCSFSHAVPLLGPGHEARTQLSRASNGKARSNTHSSRFAEHQPSAAILTALLTACEPNSRLQPIASLPHAAWPWQLAR